VLRTPQTLIISLYAFGGFLTIQRSAAFGPLRPDQGFNRPSHISYRGVKPAKVSAALGRCYLRRGAALPQVPRHKPDQEGGNPPNMKRSLALAWVVCALALGLALVFPP
jgi:hypothetical protein